MSGDAAIDTNAAIDLLNNAGRVLKVVERYGDIYLPVPVLGELRFGAYRSSRVSENLAKIDSLEVRCSIIDVDSEVADQYGSIRADLAKAGTPIPENDIWIGACCRFFNLPLITSDRHFDAIDGLDTIAPK